MEDYLLKLLNISIITKEQTLKQAILIKVMMENANSTLKQLVLLLTESITLHSKMKLIFNKSWLILVLLVQHFKFSMISSVTMMESIQILTAALNQQTLITQSWLLDMMRLLKDKNTGLLRIHGDQIGGLMDIFGQKEELICVVFLTVHLIQLLINLRSYLSDYE